LHEKIIKEQNNEEMVLKLNKQIAAGVEARAKTEHLIVESAQNYKAAKEASYGLFKIGLYKIKRLNIECN
jgi:hypothetical protein